MITLDRYKLFFVHIPKTAGSSIRASLLSLDSEARSYNSVENGRLDITHIQLDQLESYDPSIASRLASYHSFAVVRDPLKRFPSSLSQHARMYWGRELRDLTKAETHRAIDGAIAHLQEGSAVSDPQFIHFEKQSAYLFLQGVPAVSAVWPVEAIPQMLADIETRTGTHVEQIGHVGRTVDYRSGPTRMFMRNIYPRIGPLVRGLLPERYRTVLRQAVYRPAPPPNFMRSAEIQNFVKSHYSDDFEIFKAAQGDPGAAPSCVSP